MAIKNHNFRFNEEKEAERKAWQILHSEEVKEDFRSQNEFVIAAINDYYARHLALKGDPYLESREKEDAFVKGIIEAVEQKVLDNLPGLAGMYMMQQQSLLSVLGLQGMVPVQQQVPMPQMVAGMKMSGQVSASVQESDQRQEAMVGGDGCGKRDYTEEDEKKYKIEPDINEFLDFSFCGE
jgi:hypothetical protein